jgi:hypothetical protein
VLQANSGAARKGCPSARSKMLLGDKIDEYNVPYPMANEFQITLKIERAKKHIADLQRELGVFLDAKPYKVGAKHDPQTRNLIYYVTSVNAIPDCVPLIAGDTIQNLISALDHLAYQLVFKDTGGNPPKPGKIYFPIADTVAIYEAEKCRKLQGAGKDTLKAIDATKPYKGGNDPLWMLYRLNNIDKHRLLLTVGSKAAGVNIGQLLANIMGDQLPAGLANGLGSLDLFLNPADTGFPLKEGFELYVGAVDEKPNPEQQFHFDVALSELGIIEGNSLLATIQGFATAVDNVFNDLSPLLK